MKLFFRKRYAAFLIVVLAALLVLLGRLQYRSAQQLSEATARDMAGSLESSLFDFRHSLERELTPLCLALQPSSDGPLVAIARETAKSFNLWHQTASHPELASQVFLWDSSSEAEPVLISSSGLFKTSPWPAPLAGLPSQLKSMFSVAESSLPATNVATAAANFGRGQFGWMVEEQSLVLLYPIQAAGNPAKPHTVWLVVPLDRMFFTERLLPELARYQFGGHGETYQVAVILDGDVHAVLYSSLPGFGSSPNTTADASLRLFGPPLLVRGTFLSHAPGVVFPTMAESGDPPHLFIEPFAQSPQKANLAVIAQHRQGSVEAAVASLRTRNLALNFSMLGVLAITLALVVFTSQRARTLAQMQLDFVAGVSHELRTPLTAIILAARNLEDGVVRQDALARYGAAIKSQAAQLAELVDEILLFSETHSGRHTYKIEPVDVTLGIQTTLENLAPLIESSGFTVEEDVSPDLPLVCADAAAFSQCLQNLISNSLKYGGEKQWVGVRAYRSEHGGKEEVCISVEDRGVGIASGELRQIFEPFYRSPAIASEIHGNGLGLPITNSMVQAMQGRLSVSSQPGKGSTFTIHLRPA